MAAVLGRRLIRLQCYEGIDSSQALYEWDYARQMLQIRAMSEPSARTTGGAVDQLFGPEFLLERPLLDAVRAGDGAVLLIDEVDRADDEFEAFLLELLSDFQITIPEIGTIVAERPPFVVLTSNRTRELHDALKRRCLYHWVGYPSAEREVEIVLVREPGVTAALARKVVAAVNRLRALELVKPPGVAETIDWVRSLGVLGVRGRRPRPRGRGRHHRRGGQGARRPRAGERRPGPDHLRCLTRPSLVPTLVGFARRLRDAGVPLGTGDVLTYCAAVEPLDPTDLVDLYWAGRTALVTRHDQIPVYDRVFRAYFLDEADDQDEPVPFSVQAKEEARTELQLPESQPGEEREGREVRLGLVASDVAALKGKSFAACTPEELVALRRIMRTVRLTPPRRRSRRDARGARRAHARPAAYRPRLDAHPRRPDRALVAHSVAPGCAPSC